MQLAGSYELIINIPMITPHQFYIQQIQAWCKFETANHLQRDYYPTFISNIHLHFKITITFDDQVISALRFLLAKNQYSSYSLQNSNPLSQSLWLIIDKLYVKRFLTKRQYRQLKSQNQNYFLLNRIRQFLAQVGKQIIKSADTLETAWKKCNLHNFKQTFIWLKENQIYDEVVYELLKQSKTLIDQYNEDFKVQMNRYKQQIEQNSQHVCAISQIQTNGTEQQRESQLNQISTVHSLFLMQKQKEKFGFQVKELINILIKSFKVQTYAEITFDLFGSMRSGFAILGQSDIDLSINHHRINTKSDMARALELIDQTLELYHPHGLISKILILKARVPLIKLNYEQQIGHPRATSIDCVINNYFGIENSKILRKYSKNQQIMKFCNLIKLWALRNQVINKQNVQLSLTGYGIVLMSLYFLIVHKQIGCVVRKNERYELSKFEVNIKSLLSNIKGFLHFYSRDGSFFKEKQIVCLLGKEEAMKYSYVYKEDLLINMYDFIDGTNPGRMPKAFSQQFFDKIEQSLTRLDRCRSIEEMFEARK